MHGLFHQFDNAMRNDQPDIASDYLKKADELLEMMQCDLNKSEHVLKEIQQENSSIFIFLTLQIDSDFDDNILFIN
jgi:hypothetical protein